MDHPVLDIPFLPFCRVSIICGKTNAPCILSVTRNVWSQRCSAEMGPADSLGTGTQPTETIFRTSTNAMIPLLSFEWFGNSLTEIDARQSIWNVNHSVPRALNTGWLQQMLEIYLKNKGIRGQIYS